MFFLKTPHKALCFVIAIESKRKIKNTRHKNMSPKIWLPILKHHITINYHAAVKLPTSKILCMLKIIWCGSFKYNWASYNFQNLIRKTSARPYLEHPPKRDLTKQACSKKTRMMHNNWEGMFNLYQFGYNWRGVSEPTKRKDLLTVVDALSNRRTP